jgi:hypothetical protein
MKHRKLRIAWSVVWGIAAVLLPGRFSLRTLLIATTLVAVGLGLIAWLSTRMVR